MAPQVAKIMAVELKKDEEWITNQVNDYVRVTLNYTLQLYLLNNHNNQIYNHER